MKMMKCLLKLAAVIAAIAGVAYLVVKNLDAITRWWNKICPPCPCEEAAAEGDFCDEPCPDPAEEAPAEVEAEAQEPAAEDGDTPTAEPSDFQE